MSDDNAVQGCEPVPEAASGARHGAYDPETVPPERSRFTPRNLLVTFVAVVAGVVGGTLAVHGLSGTNGSAPMATWMSEYGSTYLGVSHDVQTVNFDAAEPEVSLPRVRAACFRLGDDVATALYDPPMPNRSLEASWSSILSALRRGADLCDSGLEERSTSLLQQSSLEFAQASRGYQQLLDRVDRMH